MSSPVAVFSGTINTVHYGSGEALLYDMAAREFLGIILAFLLFFAGIIFLISALFLRQLTDRRFLYLGLFAVSMSIWILSEARVLQLFTGNRFVIGGLSYLMVTYMPIPLIFYLRDIVLCKYSKLMNYFSMLFTGLLVMNLILQISGTAHLIEVIPVTLGSLVLLAGVMLVLLFREAFSEKNPDARKFLLYAAVLVIFSFFEIAAFFFQIFDSISSFLRIGIFIFFIFLVIDSFKYINDLLRKKNEAHFYEKLAFKDILTGGFNHNAFERDIKPLIQNTEQQPFRLILLDLNDLKLINDTFGHRTGDEALKASYSALEAAFGTYGKCYRVSGDEFASILFDTNEELYESGIKNLRKKLHEESPNKPRRLEIAIGSSVYSPEQTSDFTAFYHEVDKLMYENKKQLKLHN